MRESVQVLLVGSDATFLASIAALLSDEGVGSVLVAAESAAWHRALEQDFAAMLLDIPTSVTSRLEIAETVRRHPRASKLPIILTATEIGGTGLRFDGCELAPVDYLLKPFEAHVLRSKLGVYCALYRQRMLLKADQSHRFLLDNAPVGIYQTTKDDVCIYANPRWHEISGLPVQLANDSGWRRSLVHPEDLNKVEAARRDAQANDSGWSLDYRLLKGKGQIVWVHDQATPLRDEAGVLAGYLNSCWDITLRKRDEEWESTRSAVLDRLAHGDPLHEILAFIATRAERQIPGTVECEVVDEDSTPAGQAPNISKDDAHPVWAEPIKAMTGDILGFVTLRRSSAGNPAPDDVGLIAKVAQLACLVVERKRSERQLHLATSALMRSQATLSEAQRIANIGSWEYDAATGEVLWSDQMYLIFGENRDSFVPNHKEFLNRLHPDDREPTDAAIRSAFSHGTGYTIEYRVVTPQGKTTVVLAQAERLHDEEGRPQRLVGTALDITARKNAENELMAAKAEAERANNAKSRFLAAASHDLRQPLSALNLYMDVLERKVADSDRPLLRNMKDCASGLSALLTDLLDLSKLDAGVVTPNVSSFPIAEMMANLVSVHAPEALFKGLRLRCVPSELTARTDPVLFRRMVGNLLSNALRYTERGSVLIGCRRSGGKVWVEIWDTGIGIPDDKIDEIFEEFKQLGDNARNRGSGLGLAIVAKTAALLGLEIRVRSRLGCGSMFAVEMPLGTRPRKLAARRIKPRSSRIALVEDNAAVRQALVHALSGVGHKLVAAGTGQELLAKLGRQAPDIVISDYRLADGVTGFDVITSVRAAFGDALPAILITGDTDPQLMRSMASRGIVVQHKPLEIEALQVCIGGLMKDEIIPPG